MSDKRKVRVACPDCPGGGDRWPDCGRCSPEGTISLGLIDPAAEALMAVGEATTAWMNMEGGQVWTGPEVQRVFAAVKAYNALSRAPEDGRGVEG